MRDCEPSPYPCAGARAAARAKVALNLLASLAPRFSLYLTFLSSTSSRLIPNRLARHEPTGPLVHFSLGQDCVDRVRVSLVRALRSSPTRWLTFFYPRSGTKFTASKKDLAYNSTVFADMFEAGTSDGVDEVALAESAKVLEAVLELCQSGDMIFEKSSGSTFWEVTQAFDKYEVSLASTESSSPEVC